VATRVKSDARRQEVVSKAAELFDQAGYYTTNMSELARAVGLEKPTLYHYFSGKDEILFWIHEEFINHLIEKGESRDSSTLTATAELEATFKDLLELMDSHRGHVRVFFEHGRELTEEHQSTIRTKRDKYQAIVQGIVERGIKEKEFRDLDPRLVTLAIFGMCNWSYQWYRSGGALQSDEIASFFFSLLLDGLRV
jgi:AcrR family transcriptional regulator